MRTTTGFVAAITLLVSAAIAQDKPAFRTIAETDLASVFKQKSTLVVDARMPDERGKWGLACTNCSTVNVPFDFGSDDKTAAAGLKAFTDAAAKSKEIAAAKAAGQEVLVVCLAGGRSGAAAEHLAKMGVKAVLLADGLGGLKDAKNIKGSKPKG